MGLYVGAGRVRLCGIKPSRQPLQHRQPGIPCFALRSLAQLQQDEILAPTCIQQAQQHGRNLAPSQALFKCHVDPDTGRTDALLALAGFLQSRYPSSADLQNGQQHLFQIVANQFENARVLVCPATDPVHQQIEETLQLGVEKSALVIGCHCKLLDEVEHLPGGMLR